MPIGLPRRGRGRRKGARIRLHEEARRQLLEHCREQWPREACGLLLGDESGVRVASPARNVRAGDRRHRFELDPRDFVAADGAARDRGLEIVGSYHSHPEGGASPSPRDLEAAEPGWSQLIVGRPRAAEPELRSFRLTAGRLAEEAIESWT